MQFHLSKTNTPYWQKQLSPPHVGKLQQVILSDIHNFLRSFTSLLPLFHCTVPTGLAAAALTFDAFRLWIFSPCTRYISFSTALLYVPSEWIDQNDYSCVHPDAWSQVFSKSCSLNMEWKGRQGHFFKKWAINESQRTTWFSLPDSSSYHHAAALPEPVFRFNMKSSNVFTALKWYFSCGAAGHANMFAHWALCWGFFVAFVPDCRGFYTWRSQFSFKNKNKSLFGKRERTVQIFAFFLCICRLPKAA